MRILIVGGGGREHALAWKISQSPLCSDLHVAPGNGGIAMLATCHAVAADNVAGQLQLAKTIKADFVIVAPDTPLVLGLADLLRAEGFLTFGPSKAAAQVEGSKDFTKRLCRKYNIPTADYETFSDAAAAKHYIRAKKAPYVIKADGLALGKGVTIAADLAEADAAIDDALLDNKFGASGAKIVIEDFLTGQEVSFFALCDGERALPFGFAQDHKQVGEGDTGPMTGGMGAYSPVPFVDQALEDKIMRDIVLPSLAGLKKDGAAFSGFLFAGLMVDESGDPKLIEYNCRSGDPETQVLMMQLDGDVLPAMIASAKNDLSGITLNWKKESVMTVVMASQGYPGDYQKNTVIKNLDKINNDNVFVFHAGTKQGAQGEWLAVGGRVLNVTATGKDLAAAKQQAYKAIDQIDWPEGFCRRDIGDRVL